MGYCPIRCLGEVDPVPVHILGGVVAEGGKLGATGGEQLEVVRRAAGPTASHQCLLQPKPGGVRHDRLMGACVISVGDEGPGVLFSELL